jgi:hypothetical protein
MSSSNMASILSISYKLLNIAIYSSGGYCNMSYKVKEASTDNYE